MHRWVEEYGLCQKLTGIDKSEGNCFKYTIKECHGACIEQESPEEYNIRAKELIGHHSLYMKSMIIIDRGRAVDEQSLVLIEEGKFKGIGYFNLNHQVTNLEILHSLITPMHHNRDAQHIIQSYVRKQKKLKIINLKQNE